LTADLNTDLLSSCFTDVVNLKWFNTVHVFYIMIGVYLTIAKRKTKKIKVGIVDKKINF